MVTLFRGDSIPNEVLTIDDVGHKGRTFVEHYADGLYAKSSQSMVITNKTADQLSRLTDKKISVSDINTKLKEIHIDPLYQVLCHIGGIKGTIEEIYKNHSPRISFSEIRETAFYYMDREGKYRPQACEMYEASNFIWELTIPDSQLVNEGDGTFGWIYKASPNNIRESVARQFASENLDDKAAAVLKGMVGVYQNIDNRDHSLNLCKAREYLEFHKEALNRYDSSLVDRSLKWADEADEWLVYPCDFGDGFVSSRLHSNENLIPIHFCQIIK